MPEQDINSRIALCKFVIEVLMECADDPRQPDALKHYQEQLAGLEAQLKPPPIVVGLKAAALFGKVPK